MIGKYDMSYNITKLPQFYNKENQEQKEESCYHEDNKYGDTD